MKCVSSLRAVGVYCGCRREPQNTLKSSLENSDFFSDLDSLFVCLNCEAVKCEFCTVYEPVKFYCSKCFREYTTRETLKSGGMCTYCMPDADRIDGSDDLHPVINVIESDLKLDLVPSEIVQNGGYPLRAKYRVSCKRCRKILLDPGRDPQLFEFTTNESAVKYIPKIYKLGKKLLVFNLGNENLQIEIASEDGLEHIPQFEVKRPVGQRPPPYLAVREPVALKDPPAAGWAACDLELGGGYLFMKVNSNSWSIDMYLSI